jgi:hypothetical protein
LFRNGEAQISLVDLGAGRALMDGTRGLDEATPEQLLEYVLTLATDQRDREVVVRKQRMIHGHEWTEVDTWNRVSNQDRLRIAFLDDDGYLLALAMDRGPIEQTGLAFETLLASFEVTPAPR